MSAGYQACCVDGNPKTGLTCTYCKLLLRKPVQTEEGVRLCRVCVEKIKSLPGGHCDDCDVTLTSDSQFYPDKAVEREIQSLVVFCQFKSNGCEWQGPLKKLEDHVSECEFKGVICPYDGCGLSLKVSDVDEHMQICGFRPIKCDHCSATLPHNNIKKHELECEEMIIPCDEETCSATFKRKERSVHKEKYCAVTSCVTCGEKVNRATGMEVNSLRAKTVDSSDARPERAPRKTSTCRGMSQDVSQLNQSRCEDPDNNPLPGAVHLSDPVQNFQHHQDIAIKVRDLESTVKEVLSQQESNSKEISVIKKDNDIFKAEKEQMGKDLLSVKAEVSEIKVMVHNVKGQLPGKHGQTEDKVLAKLERLLRADQERSEAIDKLESQFKILQSEFRTGDSGFGSGSFGMVDTDSRSFSRKGVGAMDYTALGSGFNPSNFQYMKQMEEFQRQLGTMRVQLSELELQLQASLASTYNGNFLWRIPDVTRRRRDAVDGRVTSIYSPPFYTGRNGYKMCIRGYLNGDGMGYQSHLSLFFVIMRGECDPLLKWPFEYKVSMILVDQTHRKHIVQTFKPTPESNSFQQPKTEMNVASGCPQFAKLSVFDDPCYVKDDVMYIKCIIDTSKIFHP